MKDSDISPIIREKAPLILAEIKKAKSILLHCHPSPDPDSVGSALAMKFALESLGKKATVIRGDSEIPQAFMHFPGADSIVPKNFGEVDLKEFDLFIIQDSGSTEMMSRWKKISFPLPIRTVVIDHHPSNPSYADLNLVEPSYPAVAQILFELFKEWKIKLTHDIAVNLFMGIYTDTGGFKYSGTTARTFEVAGELIGYVPEFPKLISDMENSATLDELVFRGEALSSIETFFNGRMALSLVPHSFVKSGLADDKSVSAGSISTILRTMVGFDVVGACIETTPGVVKTSFRSKDGDRYDVSKLAVAFGGGGHKAAAGATLNMPLDEAKRQVVAKAKELYNL